jgi:hypothetical protein
MPLERTALREDGGQSVRARPGEARLDQRSAGAAALAPAPRRLGPAAMTAWSAHAWRPSPETRPRAAVGEREDPGLVSRIRCRRLTMFSRRVCDRDALRVPRGGRGPPSRPRSNRRPPSTSAPCPRPVSGSPRSTTSSIPRWSWPTETRFCLASTTACATSAADHVHRVRARPVPHRPLDRRAS